MKKIKKTYIDIEIDKLTNSIENTLTGEVFDTEIIKLSEKDINLIKKTEWQFNCVNELKDKSKEVYKLATVNNPKIIQGLMSIEDKSDHVFIHLVESAKFNKGQAKVYYGVPANLVAFACKKSFEKGYDGFVAFDSKSALIEHYKKSLGAILFRGQRMFIETKQAGKLVSQYFKS